MGNSNTSARGRGLRGRVLALVLPVLATLSIVLILDLLGVVDLLEAGFQRGHAATAEAVGVSRESSERVVVVAGDQSTIAAWGPPPWSESQRAALVQTINAGEPDAVIELGHPPMFIATTPSGSRLDASGAMIPSERLHELESRGVLPPVPARLPVQWLTPSARLPVVPAAQVASGKIPARTFAGRVVVLGLTDPDYALPIATPVGPLSLVEIEAHALTGLDDDRIPVELAPVWSYLGCVLVAVLLLGIRSRVGTRAWVLTIGFGVVALLVLEFALVEIGLVRLMNSRLVLALLAFASVTAIVERLATLAAIARLHAWMERELIDLNEDAPAPASTDSGFWTELAERGAVHAQAIAGPSACVSVLERDLDTNALALRASAGLDPISHAALATLEPIERCGSAFWSASLTRRVRWAQLVEAHKSMIVPLPATGSLTPIGIWLVHLPFEVELGHADLIEFERFGRLFAAAIESWRERAALRDPVEPGQPSAQLDDVTSKLTLLRAAQQRSGLVSREVAP